MRPLIFTCSRVFILCFRCAIPYQWWAISRVGIFLFRIPRQRRLPILRNGTFRSKRWSVITTIRLWISYSCCRKHFRLLVIYTYTCSYHRFSIFQNIIPLSTPFSKSSPCHMAFSIFGYNVLSCLHAIRNSSFHMNTKEYSTFKFELFLRFAQYFPSRNYRWRSIGCFVACVLSKCIVANNTTRYVE